MFSTYNPLAVYPADGVQTEFAAPDLFYDVNDIEAVIVVNGDEIPVTRGIDFSVVVVGREATPPYRQTGFLRFTTPPIVGANVVPFIFPSLVQDQGFEGRTVTPRQHERVHDRHVQSIAMLFEFFNRGYRSPLDTPAALRFIAAGRGGYVPTWDDDGNLIEGPRAADLIAAAGIATSAAAIAQAAADYVAGFSDELNSLGTLLPTVLSARDEAVNAAKASGITKYADTYAAAVAALPTYVNNDVVLVFADENNAGSPAQYRVVAGALVLKLVHFASPAEARAGLSNGKGITPLTAKEAIWANAVDVRAFGAKIDGVTDDTAAWKAAFATGKPVYHPGGRSLVYDQLVYGPFSLVGPNTNGRDTNSDRAVIVMMKGGKTPLCSNYQINVCDVGVEFGDTAITPIGNLTYGKAHRVVASIATVGSDVIMTVPGGGLIANTSVGSSVVAILDTATKDFDYYVNNYDDIRSVFIIKEIISDTQCKLFARTGTTIASQPMYVRGSGIASVWTGLYQPSRVTIRRPLMSRVPGFAIVLTGAQQVDIDTVWGGGHIAAIGAFPEAGQDPLDTGGTYHHVRINGVMNFQFSGGVIMASGLQASQITQCQYDPNGYAQAQNNFTGATNTYFANPVAPYSLYSCFNLDFVGNTCEDHNSPFCFSFRAGGYLHWDNLQTYDTPDSTTFRYQIMSWIEEGLIRRAGTFGPMRLYTSMGSAAQFEVQINEGGRDGKGIEGYRNGFPGARAPYITTRDVEILKFSLPAATLKALAASQYDFNIAQAVLAGWFGFGLNILTNILIDHGAAWTSTGGTPTVSIGNPTDVSYLKAPMSLNQPAGFYMNAKNLDVQPVALVAGALGTAGLRLRFLSGGGILMNAAGFVPQDLSVYLHMQRFRS